MMLLNLAMIYSETFREFWWTDPESVITYFDRVKSVLDARAHICNPWHKYQPK